MRESEGQQLESPAAAEAGPAAVDPRLSAIVQAWDAFRDAHEQRGGVALDGYAVTIAPVWAQRGRATAGAGEAIWRVF